MPPNENNCDPENCTAMPKAELQANLKNIFDSIEDVKDGIKEIKDGTRSPYKSILEQQKDIEFLKEKGKELKTDVKDEFNIIHEKFRIQEDEVQEKFDVREKNVKWWFLAIVAVSSLVSGMINVFYKITKMPF